MERKESSRGWSQLGLPSWRNTRRLSHPLVSSSLLPLYFRRQSSTFAPLLTTSFLFLSFIPLFFFYLFFTYVCVCIFFFFHCLVRHTPIAYVWSEEAFSFPFLGQPPTLKFLQSPLVVSTLVLCFSFAGFFPGLRTYYFLCLFLVLRAPPFDLDGGRRRYLQRSWSEGILNVCGGNLRFDLFLSGDIFVILLLILRGLFLS